MTDAATYASSRIQDNSDQQMKSSSTVTAINILLTSFAGLGLPRTLSLPVKSDTTIHDVLAAIYARLPPISQPLIITTTSNKQLLSSDHAPISTILPSASTTFLPLRLSARLCGGKGGFGSQLRAAGGRMSSRKNRNNAQANPNGSNRNLDGRRLRTVDEAKRLAEYLAIKPEMEKKEREERRKRWEAVVAAAEKREEEIMSGKSGANQGRLDAEFVESKEAAEEKTREAVMKAMREGMLGLERTGSESSAGEEKVSQDEGEGVDSEESSAEGERMLDAESGPSFYGWDEDDEDDDEGEGEEVEEDDPCDAETTGDSSKSATNMTYEGKGKNRAV